VIDGLAAHLFWGHVADGTNERAFRCRAAAHLLERHGKWTVTEELRDAEVEQLHASIGRDEHVLGFDVPVDDSLVVCRRKPARNLNRVISGAVDRECTAIEVPAKRVAFEQFGNQIRRAFMRADVEYGEDVWMVERRCRTRFLFEPAHPIGIATEGIRQHLQCDVAPEARVGGAVHLAHPAAADQRGHEITTELRADERSRRWLQKRSSLGCHREERFDFAL
jgi:hypothetical protein